MKTGFLHSPFKNAVRPNRPIVVEGLDDKLKEHYENWERMEGYLISNFEKSRLGSEEILKTLKDSISLSHSAFSASDKTLAMLHTETQKQLRIIKYLVLGLVGGSVGYLCGLFF